MNYYPFHIGDYTAHTAHLDPLEDLAYRRLLDAYYLAERPLPADVAECARLVRLRNDPDVVRVVLEEFFALDEHGWRNPRADDEIAAMQMKKDANEERQEGKQTRLQRFRKKRSEMFHALQGLGIVPDFNIPMGDLRRLFSEKCGAFMSDETGESVSSAPNDETGLATGVETPCDADATALPIANSQYPIAKRKKEEAQAPFVLPDWIPAEAWAGYVDMRKKIRKPMTDRARNLKISLLAGFKRAGHDIGAILDKSTENNWTDLYAPKPEHSGYSARQPQAPSGETPYQRQMRERMQSVVPGVAAKAPGAQPATQPQTEIFDVTAKRVD